MTYNPSFVLEGQSKKNMIFFSSNLQFLVTAISEHWSKLEKKGKHTERRAQKNVLISRKNSNSSVQLGFVCFEFLNRTEVTTNGLLSKLSRGYLVDK